MNAACISVASRTPRLLGLLMSVKITGDGVSVFPQDKFDECKRHVDEAKRVLLVTHGGGHSVVKETLESLVQQYNAFAFSTMLTNGSGVKPIS